MLAARKPNKEGGPDDIRVCIDARQLNQIITKVPDNNLPGLRKVLDRLENFEWISVIDLADSYQQFPIKKEDRIKVAFGYASSSN